MKDNPIRLVLIDDQQMWLEALSALLSGLDEVEVVGMAANGPDALELCRREKPAQVLLDLRMPGMDGLEVLEQLLSHQPGIKAIFLTAHDDPFFIREGLSKGVRGYVLKGSSKEELSRAFRQVEAGHYYFDPKVLSRLVQVVLESGGRNPAEEDPCPLTPREKEILALLAAGKTSSEIAEELYISINTVETHRKNILSKFGAKNILEAVNKARENQCLNQP